MLKSKVNCINFDLESLINNDLRLKPFDMYILYIVTHHGIRGAASILEIDHLKVFRRYHEIVKRLDFIEPG